ncbi:MAG TPA: nucleotide sugar dehydrogenase, partial [Gallicola sp.]|nr:nucleotide sugar dehydrogenase [Gallicola sp.]
SYDAVILAVAHEKFNDLDIAKITNGNRVVYDVKGVLGRGVDAKL